MRRACSMSATIDRRSASERPIVLSAAIVLSVFVISLTVASGRRPSETAAREPA
jgi:hypothetical protein